MYTVQVLGLWFRAEWLHNNNMTNKTNVVGSCMRCIKFELPRFEVKKLPVSGVDWSHPGYLTIPYIKQHYCDLELTRVSSNCKYLIPCTNTLHNNVMFTLQPREADTSYHWLSHWSPSRCGPAFNSFGYTSNDPSADCNASLTCQASWTTFLFINWKSLRIRR